VIQRDPEQRRTTSCCAASGKRRPERRLGPLPARIGEPILRRIGGEIRNARPLKAAEPIKAKFIVGSDR
jgi:hypothetical protein